MFIFDVKAGRITENGNPLEGGDTVYSGVPECRNDPAHEQEVGRGPIPRGKYKIGVAYDDPGHLGPVVMRLYPLPGTNVFGRDAFRIHGDNENHDASHGCVIVPHLLRCRIAKANDRILQVI